MYCTIVNITVHVGPHVCWVLSSLLPLSLPPTFMPSLFPPLLSTLLPPAALTEAHDISMHLKPLQRHFEEMEDCDYLELPKQFPAMFHCICLVWSHSTHYQQPARIVVLLQEVTNLLIQLVRLLWSKLSHLQHGNTDKFLIRMSLRPLHGWSTKESCNVYMYIQHAVPVLLVQVCHAIHCTCWTFH